ncbi:uncharacterized protein BT62DRAFT_999657 [Guyanagaster necrorhizus]|uniref:Uncharacterized protein n=1 Tax=Guyanagaster necrorhizus TaxID=856835 RepID=A0A9P7W3E4_9AGAR|nr:uncharacterized protein BT62DRAFT_999657 [Guyanagaster necrorhizus MCA 3950]KAG7451918.1 hypothetical protein BT62DRAFT_999657 [Guyanagaster necrorhizus MCA 3950]
MHVGPFLFPIPPDKDMLQSLKAVGNPVTPVGELLGLHDAPNLRTLHFNIASILEIFWHVSRGTMSSFHLLPGHRGLCTCAGPVVEHQSIALFTLSCCSSLWDLIIDKIPLRSQGLVEILNSLQELRYLTICKPTVPLLRAYYPISQQFTQKLLDDGTFLPKLASVDVHLHEQSTVEQSLIDNAIKRRAIHKLDSCEASSVR